MVNEPCTGVLFRSKVRTPEMRTRLQEKMPGFNWRLGDSEQYRDYYISGTRADGLKIEIQPEDEADEYYLAVYFRAMAAAPTRETELVIAREMRDAVLPVVEGIRKSTT